jgi:5'-deoxynucleotidase YfbR-like HD superfamily hydrolase
MEALIRTNSGITVNVFDPKPEHINIKDIAHALSMQVRFNGHLPKPYSVAQHSVICSQLSEPEHKLAALLHDASEAYATDLPRPIKEKVTGYKQIEDKLMEVISLKYGFKYPLDAEVKKIDDFMLRVEWEFLFFQKSPSFNIAVWNYEESKRYFLSEFERLMQGR